MTLGTTPPLIDYAENGVTVVHPIPFQFDAATDILCSRILDGIETPLTLGTDFTVAGGAGDTGSVTKASGGAAGITFRIKRFTTRAQPTDYTPGDAFPAETHEHALDRGAAVAQEQDVHIDDVEARSLRVRPGQQIAPIDKTLLPGKYLVGDSEGNLVPSTGTGADAGLRTDLAAVGGEALIGTPAGSLAAMPRRLSYGLQPKLRTVREAEAALATLPGRIVGPAAVAGTTGGEGYPVFYVNNPSFDVSMQNSLGWALEQARQAGGGQVLVEPTGRFDAVLMSTMVFNYDNVTVSAPGGNLIIWMDRIDGQLNFTAAENWIFEGVYCRTLAGPINATAIGAEQSDASSLVNIHYATCDKFAFLNCEFRHPSWHCVDITRNTVPDGHLCRVTFQNCIEWDSIQGHLFGTINAQLGPGTYTDDATPRELLILMHEHVFAYCLQRLPKALGAAYVDLANCIAIVRPYETEYVDGNGHAYPDVETAIFGAAVQEGGWVRTRACLFASADPLADGRPATHLMGDGAYSGNSGRISNEGSVAENGMVFETRNPELIDALSYELDVVPVPADGPAREAWVQSIWSRAGARRDAAPDGLFVWTDDTSKIPNGETVLLNLDRKRTGQWRRVDTPREYPAPPEHGSATLEASPRSRTRTVGFQDGKTTEAAIGPKALDLAALDSNYFVAQGNGAPANVSFLMSTNGFDLTLGLHLLLGGSSAAPITLKSAVKIDASGVLTAGANTITIPGHGMSDGDWPVFFTSTGVMPDGLVTKQGYFGVVVDANTLKLAATYADAISGVAGSVVPIHDAGTGTLSAHIGNLNLPGGTDLVLSGPTPVIHLLLDEANLQFQLVSAGTVSGGGGGGGGGGGSGVGFAANRLALAAMATTAPVYLTETGHEGTFVFHNTNLSARVAIDPQQGIYVAPSADATGASGAWVRA